MGALLGASILVAVGPSVVSANGAMAEEGLGCVCYRTEGLSGDSGLSYGVVRQQGWLWVSSFMLRLQR